MCESPQIRKLDEDVINRIAAGEIIQRPANALKELIENSLDAKSTNINITVKSGGLKFLQIQDNGCGIRQEDFDIVCERFTTSKLKEFEDLKSISTYGFRGEALASISHIAHLTITSKTKNSVFAYQAQFIDGILQGTPKPIAGNQGTIITVEDLFFNMNVRRKALRSPAEEFQKICDVVNKYAIHNATVGFSLKKFGESNNIKTQPNSNHCDNISLIYGNSIARELIEFNLEHAQYRFKVHGYMTNVNYSTKKFQFLLFINNRLVDCQGLKKAIDQVYSTYLPKNTHPFVYLSLELDPVNVDVNVHPTKHEVRFLNEEQIIEAISSEMETKLLGSNNCRTFFTQTKLPGFEIETFELKDNDKKSNKTILPKDLVRTSFSEQKLEKFFGPTTSKAPIKTENRILNDSITDSEFEKYHENFLEGIEKLESKALNETVNSEPTIISQGKPMDFLKSTNIVQEVKEEGSKNYNEKSNLAFMAKVAKSDTKLTSVLTLRKDIEKNFSSNLREIFSQHVFVGAVDPTQALIQFSTRLYLCNTKKVLEELFYQLILYNFQNFDYVSFSRPLSIYDLALTCLDLPETGWTPEDGPKEELAQKITEVLTEKGAMLEDYFSLDVNEHGELKSLPIILQNYLPDMKGLPMYLLRLATEVNWEKEKECFVSFARETAQYYAQVPEKGRDGQDWKWITEHVLYPAIKEYFIPPSRFLKNAAVLEIANLPNLYKVFERC